MGGMIAVVVLALLMVPVFFVTVQRFFAGDDFGRQRAADRGGAEDTGIDVQQVHG